MRRIQTNRGFTLIELVIIIVILGILASVATMKFSESTETAKIEATKSELLSLSFAIAGNPEIFTNGARADFGYVGDIGALPPNLNALATNPGLGTWDGPYIKGDFQSGDFANDAWNTPFILAGTTIRSTGAGTDIETEFASSTGELLNNSVSGYILDASMQMPGTTFDDSLIVNLIYPDGSGGTTAGSITPDKGGNFSFSSIPVGNHKLQVIFIPDSDTMSYIVCVEPNSSISMEILFPHDLW
ncbi:MAG: prepilin-type N-terminal cleavage/methylation domain-containing protein [Candidatus Zixiibacteriota bacterium]